MVGLQESVYIDCLGEEHQYLINPCNTRQQIVDCFATERSVFSRAKVTNLKVHKTSGEKNTQSKLPEYRNPLTGLTGS